MGRVLQTGPGACTHFREQPADTKCVSVEDQQVASSELLPTEDAAKLLGISPSALRRFAWRQEIPSIKLGRARNAHRFFEPRVIEVARRGGIAALDELQRESTWTTKET
jgi:hypothetical protein